MSLFLGVIVETLACIDTGLAFVDLLFQKLADLVFDRTFDLGIRFHLIDVVRRLQTDDIQDRKRSGRSGRRQLLGQVDRLRIGNAVGP